MASDTNDIAPHGEAAYLLRRNIRANDIAQAEGIHVTQAGRMLRLTLLAPAVIEKLLADADALVNLGSVLRRVMPLDWREQDGLFLQRH